MPRALIDSSALIGGLPEDVLGALEQHCSSTIVRAELAYGLSVFAATGQISRAARRRTLIDALDGLDDFWRDFDIDASEGYGRLTALTPQAMRAKDALIAGHAHSLGIPVITRDAGFTRFSSVVIRVLSAAE